MVRVALLLVTFAFAGSSVAQDTPDLLGRWAVETPASGQDERCGEKKTVGEMHVTKKITARAFRGSATAQTVTEKCGVVGADGAATGSAESGHPFFWAPFIYVGPPR